MDQERDRVRRPIESERMSRHAQNFRRRSARSRRLCVRVRIDVQNLRRARGLSQEYPAARVKIQQPYLTGFVDFSVDEINACH
jgi:ribosome-binding protein aMBF1 (putative translation factor)